MSRALGGFEQLILLALLRLGDGTNGVAIRREIEARTGKEASTGALYTTLERLEKRGLISCEMGESTPERGGRRKKLYSMQAAGSLALRESYAAFASMVHGVEAQLAPADGRARDES
jgi:PadR family transcriptional regulator